MNATLPSGDLNEFIFEQKCYIDIAGNGMNETIVMQSLPDISDSKGAGYSDETSIGRSTPFKTYNNSDNRTINWNAHFMVTKKEHVEKFFGYIRAIQAAVYPFDSRSSQGGLGGAPYAPPPICKLQCGDLLSKLPLNAIMKSYSIKFDTSVPWDEDTFLPYKFDIDMTFDIIYDQSNLPDSTKILNDS